MDCTSDSSPAGTLRWKDLARRAAPFACVTAAAFVLLAVSARVPPIDGDPARDLLFARDCIDLGACSTIGPTTSLLHFCQGANWIDLISTVRLLGGSVRALQWTVITVQALGCGLLFAFARRIVSPLVASLSAGVFVVVLCSLGDDTLLWNHSLLALIVVVASGAMLVGVQTERSAAMWIAAFWTGVGIGTHVQCAELLLAVVVGSVLFPARPWRTLQGTLVAVSLPLVVLSWGAVEANVAVLVNTGAGAVAVGGLAVLVVLARLVARRYAALGSRGKCLVLAALLLLPALPGTVWVRTVGHSTSLHYYYPMLPAVALLAGAGLEALAVRISPAFGRTWLIAGAALGVLASSVSLRFVNHKRDWTAPDARALTKYLVSHGYSYRDAALHLQSPDVWSALTAISVFMPPPRASKPAESPPDLFVWRPAPGDPRLAGGVYLRTNSGDVLFVHESRDWLSVEGGRVCRVRPGRAAACRRLVLRSDERVAGFRFEHRSYPRLYRLPVVRPYETRITFPLHPRGRRARVFQVLEDDELCPWRFVAVHGARVAESLPAERITIEPNRSGGEVTIAREYRSECRELDTEFRPSVLEVPPSQIALLDAVAKGRARHE